MPGPRQENVVHDGRPRDAAEQAQGDDDGGEGNDPEGVFRKEDLTGRAHGADVVGLLDQAPSEVRRHREVGNGAREKGDGEKIMENFLAGPGCPRQNEEDEL